MYSHKLFNMYNYCNSCNNKDCPGDLRTIKNKVIKHRCVGYKKPEPMKISLLEAASVHAKSMSVVASLLEDFDITISSTKYYPFFQLILN
uniref:Uncharacterized protein n=1 Tax=viral metagenome TaxID=1070528 RepID=A0A6M3LQZ1_9ZZZZ